MFAVLQAAPPSDCLVASGLLTTLLPACGWPAGMRPGSWGTCPTRVARWRRLQTASHTGELPAPRQQRRGLPLQPGAPPLGPAAGAGPAGMPVSTRHCGEARHPGRQHTIHLETLLSPVSAWGTLGVTHPSSGRTQPHLSAIPWEHCGRGPVPDCTHGQSPRTLHCSEYTAPVRGSHAPKTEPRTRKLRTRAEPSGDLRPVTGRELRAGPGGGPPPWRVVSAVS